jgi:hypothetical protein
MRVGAVDLGAVEEGPAVVDGDARRGLGVRPVARLEDLVLEPARELGDALACPVAGQEAPARLEVAARLLRRGGLCSAPHLGERGAHRLGRDRGLRTGEGVPHPLLERLGASSAVAGVVGGRAVDEGRPVVDAGGLEAALQARQEVV